MMPGIGGGIDTGGGGISASSSATSGDADGFSTTGPIMFGNFNPGRQGVPTWALMLAAVAALWLFKSKR